MLRAFNHVCVRTGSVIDAPIQHPELFGAFRKFFVGETIAIEMKPQGAARDGVFGALDPYTSKYVCPNFGFVLRCH